LTEYTTSGLLPVKYLWAVHGLSATDSEGGKIRGDGNASGRLGQTGAKIN